MKTDVKSAIANILLKEKINYVFGHTGGHIRHLWEAINNLNIGIILNKQEGNAVYMADAYTRITKKPSIILGTAGPGATNMITGMATAYLDSIPLIAICGSVSTSNVGRNPIQDCSGLGRSINQTQAFKAVCKEAILVSSPENIPNIIREAFKIAVSGRPGPVYIEIPTNFWNIKINYKPININKYKNYNIPLCNKNDIDEIKKSLYKAKKPLLIIGEGAEEKNIKSKLKKFIKKVKIPFGVSPIAKNFVDEFDDYYLGVMRSRGKTQKIYEYMRESDFIIFLGNRMQEWETNGYDETLIKKSKIAQIDIDPEEIGKVFPVDYSAVGSISSFIDSDKFKIHKNSLQLKKLIEKIKSNFPRKNKYSDSKKGINALNITNLVEKYISNNSSIVCDTGNAKSLAIMKIRTNLTQNFLVADNNGPMGYGIPAGLGASLATNKEVICFVGDGGFHMSSNELGLLLNYDLKVIYIVFNNGGCFTIHKSQVKDYGKHCATDFKNPNFIKLAESYNMDGYKVKTSKEFENVFKKAQKSNKSTIIEAIVDDELIIWE